MIDTPPAPPEFGPWILRPEQTLLKNLGVRHQNFRSDFRSVSITPVVTRLIRRALRSEKKKWRNFHVAVAYRAKCFRVDRVSDIASKRQHDASPPIILLLPTIALSCFYCDYIYINITVYGLHYWIVLYLKYYILLFLNMTLYTIIHIPL